MITGFFGRQDHHIGFAPLIRLHSPPSRLAAWLDRQRQRVHLSQLDEHLLDDVGLDLRAATVEARRWT